MKETRPFSMKDKIGYTLGDLGCCCTEQFRAMYLAIFYTLVLKVNPVHVGILMLITKFWDAINDPLIGALVDSHKNKGKGKFIPWIKFFAFPTAEGGMSGSYLYKDQEAKYDYIADVFDTLIVRDIRKKYKIRNTQLMDRIVDFLMDNVSNLSSARNITNTLGSMQEKIHHTTVGNYMQYLCNAFAFYKVRRYDIKGKKYLSSNDKYYLSDHTFRYAKLGTKNMDYGRILENIVAIELLRRGYEVYVGILYKKEIDFVAVKRSEKIYIQVSDNISEEKTFEREVAPLLQIKDAYPKYVIARTRHDEYQYEGIKVIDIADWLLDK